MITDSQIGNQILQVLAFDHISDHAIFLFTPKGIDMTYRSEFSFPGKVGLSRLTRSC